MAIEAKRACGYRVIHGLYLVGGFTFRECDRLPLEVGHCPICGQGIKFSRGLTEINAHKLWGDHRKCKESGRHCNVCTPPEGLNYLMFVGNEYTPDTFISEAVLQGVSKRIPFIPKKMKLGETVVYLAHYHAIKSLEPTDTQVTMDTKQVKMIDTEKKVKKSLGVFCAFIPQRIEQLFHESEITDELKKKCEKRGITIVPVPDDDQEHKLF